MKLSMIWAQDKNRLIGNQNKLPWHLPADLAHFKKQTLNHPMIMGRKTFDSLPGLLPNRKHIVLSRKGMLLDSIGQTTAFTSVEEVLKYVENEEAFVIGGSEIFKLFMPYADELIITEIDHEFEGDIYAPEINHDEWQLLDIKDGLKNEKNIYKHCFKKYKRIR